MEYLIGVMLGAAVAAFANVVHLDRDRSFYPTVLIVIASYYVLFALMVSGSGGILGPELVAAGVFALAATLGFRKNLWLVAIATVGHGVFDFTHHLIIDNPGVPPWWPGFCLSFDGIVGGFLGLLLLKRTGFSRSNAAQKANAGQA
jgi:hypothetical protein